MTEINTNLAVVTSTASKNSGVNGTAQQPGEVGSYTTFDVEEIDTSDEHLSEFVNDDATDFINSNMQDMLKELGCSSVAELKAKIASGEISQAAAQKAIFDWTVKHFTYTTDSSGEDWNTFAQTIGLIGKDGKITGDCEDVAIFMACVMNSLGMEASLAINPGTNGNPGHVVCVTANPDGTYNVYDATTKESKQNQTKEQLVADGYTLLVTKDGDYDMATGTQTKDYTVEDKQFSTAGTSDTTNGSGPPVYTGTDPKMQAMWNAYYHNGTTGDINALFEEALKQASQPMTGDTNTLKGTNQNIATDINNMYATLMNMANFMTVNAQGFTKPGDLFSMQTELQMIKDAIAAVTAIGKLVNKVLEEFMSQWDSAVSGRG